MREALKLAREHIDGNFTVSAGVALAAIDKALAKLDKIAALQQKTESHDVDCLCSDCAALDDLDEALAQPEQEPVAVVETIGGYPDESAHVAKWLVPYKSLKAGDKLYTTTPQRTWVGLTGEEIDLLEELYAPPVHPDFVNDADHCTELIRHVEAKLKEKNT